MDPPDFENLDEIYMHNFDSDDLFGSSSLPIEEEPNFDHKEIIKKEIKDFSGTGTLGLGLLDPTTLCLNQLHMQALNEAEANSGISMSSYFNLKQHSSATTGGGKWIGAGAPVKIELPPTLVGVDEEDNENVFLLQGSQMGEEWLNGTNINSYFLANPEKDPLLPEDPPAPAPGPISTPPPVVVKSEVTSPPSSCSSGRRQPPRQRRSSIPLPEESSLDMGPGGQGQQQQQQRRLKKKKYEYEDDTDPSVKNAKAAKLNRDKKKAQMRGLEDRVADLEGQCEHWKQEVGRVGALVLEKDSQIEQLKKLLAEERAKKNSGASSSSYSKFKMVNFVSAMAKTVSPSAQVIILSPPKTSDS